MANKNKIQGSGSFIGDGPAEQFEGVNSNIGPPPSGEAGQEDNQERAATSSAAGHGVMSPEQHIRVLARLSLPPMR